MIQAALFDLDGTLLPMDQNKFLKAYFGLMLKKLSAYGYDDKLVDSIWKCTAKMIANNGSAPNSDVFWQAFADIYGKDALSHIPVFDDYYVNEFQAAKEYCGFNAQAGQTVKRLKESGVRVILATNPFFPAVGTHSRARWAGLDPDDFEIITTYENIGYCKPNPEYYKEILNRLKLSPKECIMVGNDVDEDIVPASSLGINVFLLTDCLINSRDADISEYPHGNFAELNEYLKTL